MLNFQIYGDRVANKSCKHDPHFVNVIIYHQEAVLIKDMKYSFLNFLYLQILVLQLWILTMLKLSLTLMNMKNGATQLSILLLETAASKMRNRNHVCNTCAHRMDQV